MWATFCIFFFFCLGKSSFDFRSFSLEGTSLFFSLMRQHVKYCPQLLLKFGSCPHVMWVFFFSPHAEIFKSPGWRFSQLYCLPVWWHLLCATCVIQLYLLKQQLINGRQNPNSASLKLYTGVQVNEPSHYTINFMCQCNVLKSTHYTLRHHVVVVVFVEQISILWLFHFFKLLIGQHVPTQRGLIAAW